MTLSLEESIYLVNLRDALILEKDRLDSLRLEMMKDNDTGSEYSSVGSAAYYLGFTIDHLNIAAFGEEEIKKDEKMKITITKSAYVSDPKPEKNWPLPKPTERRPGHSETCTCKFCKTDFGTVKTTQLSPDDVCGKEVDYIGWSAYEGEIYATCNLKPGHHGKCNTREALALPPAKNHSIVNGVPTVKWKGIKKKLSEMTIDEIGTGTIIYDPQGSAWRTEIYKGSIDLKSLDGKTTRFALYPKDLKGFTYQDEAYLREIIEIMADNRDADKMEGFTGWLAAEVTKKTGLCDSPLAVIKRVRKAVEKKEYLNFTEEEESQSD